MDALCDSILGDNGKQLSLREKYKHRKDYRKRNTLSKRLLKPRPPIHTKHATGEGVAGIRLTANYYDLLGVKHSASLEEIKTAFFDKSKKLHPDSDPNNPSLHDQFVELNEAYRVLSRDTSRKEYDLRIRHPYPGSQPFRPTSTHTYSPTADQAERVRYWEQFHYAQDPGAATERREQKRKRNVRLVGYCVLLMVLSMGAHWVGFRKLEEVHTNFMDEKDRVITEIYNESKERARVNGFKKQTEILRQKQAEFREKYNMRSKDDK